MTGMKKVLFLSAHNSCRSQMAQGIVNHHYQGQLVAASAGIDPVELNSLTKKVMGEIGINLSGHKSHQIEDFKDAQFDYIVTLCNNTRELCPVFWAQGEATIKHFEFEDPDKFIGSEEGKLKYFRDVRDRIEERLLNFFDNEIKKQEEEFMPVNQGAY
jgi:arsenate reductase (thioredoxin)